MSKFHQNLSKSISESFEVQPLYRVELIKELRKSGNYDDSRSVVYNNTDGMIPGIYYSEGVPNQFLIILETKLDQTFSNIGYRAEVILQVICYLKQQKEKGLEIPKVAIIGSKRNCFTLPVKVLLPYIDIDIINYSRASEAYKYNTEIVKRIINDKNIVKFSYIHEITKDFNISVIVDRLLKLVKDIPLIVDLDEKYISKAFDYFTMNVLKGRKVLSNKEQRDLFLEMVLNHKGCYLHPKKKGIAVFGDYNEIRVDTKSYITLINNYNFEGYSKEDEKKFTAIADRLIEDADRRKTGDFYTPTAWVDEAHNLLTKQLGENWKEEYIVWDNSSGSKNLTRDYKFKELYSSTLDEGDLRIGERYNKGNISFKYDFLNDDVELFERLREMKNKGYVITEDDFINSKLYGQAVGLVKGLLEGQKVLFLINPPYGTASGKVSKQGISKTKINEIMLSEGVGACSQQLYAQFLYRISLIQDLFNNNSINIGFFSPTTYLTSQSFKGFRGILLKKFRFEKGFLLQASNFTDVSNNWGISFSLLSSTNKIRRKNTNTYNFDVKKMEGTKIKTVCKKLLYNLDNQESCSDWVKKEITKEKTFDSVQLKSSLKWSTEKGRGSLIKGSLGYFVNISNIINANNQDVYLLSSCAYRGNGISILPGNFKRVVSNFTARRLISREYADWVNWQDEYMIPDTGNLLYKQWEADCIVYSIFNNKSNQSSLRGVNYNEKEWDILNHFFFMSVDEMKRLAGGYYNKEDLNKEIEDDIDEHGEDRYVYRQLQELILSPDAQAILNKARDLVILSFKNREIFDIKNPDFNINTWDAGWYQIKALLKEYHPEDLKEFNELYKKFEDRMRPLVYELGFLKK